MIRNIVAKLIEKLIERYLAQLNNTQKITIKEDVSICEWSGSYREATKAFFDGFIEWIHD